MDNIGEGSSSSSSNTQADNLFVVDRSGAVNDPISEVVVSQETMFIIDRHGDASNNDTNASQEPEQHWQAEYAASASNESNNSKKNKGKDAMKAFLQQITSDSKDATVNDSSQQQQYPSFSYRSNSFITNPPSLSQGSSSNRNAAVTTPTTQKQNKRAGKNSRVTDGGSSSGRPKKGKGKYAGMRLVFAFMILKC
jgi:hypothetical protein